MKRMTRNFLSLASSEVARKVFGFLAVAYLARTLTLADFGLVSLGFTILSYTLNISTAGLSLYGVREIARAPEGSFAGRLLSLRLALAAGVFLLTTVVSFLVIRDAAALKLIIVFNLSLFAYALLLEWFFQGREEMQTVSFGKSVTAAVYLVLVLVLVRSDRDVLWVAVSAVAGDFAMALFYYARYRRGSNAVRLRADRASWSGMIRESLPLGVGVLLGQISVNLAPLVIAIVMTTADVGLFSAASKLVMFLLLFDRVLGILLLPASARIHATSPEQLAPRLAEALKWILIVALPICLGGMLVSNDLVRLVYGAGYAHAASLFRILIWYLCFTMIHTVFTSGLVAVAPPGVYGRVMMTGALFYTLFTVVLTTQYGLEGAVFGVVISEGLTLLVARFKLRPYLTIRTRVALHWIAVALLAMAAVVISLNPYHVVLRVLAGAVVYGSVLVLMRVCTIQEIAALVGRKPS